MPWLATILIASAAALGRLVAVQVLPTVVLILSIWLTVRAHAFEAATADLQWRDLFADFRVDSAGVLLFVLAVFIVAALLQPFEIATVRFLEGYWQRIPGMRGAAKLFAARHRRRVDKAEKAMLEERRLDRLPEGDPRTGALNVSKRQSVVDQAAERNSEWRTRRRAIWARRIRPRYPPRIDEILPTALGNVLRAAERRAGERYSLPTVETLPRIYQQLSDRLAAAYNASVDTLDAASRMTIAATLSAVITGIAFYDDPALWWLPGVIVGVTLLSYRGTIAAAAQYGLFMDIAYDFHRFDLIKSLHLDLPASPAEEQVLGDKLKRFFAASNASGARGVWHDDSPTVTYRHNDGHTREVSSYSRDDQQADKRGYL